jgi:hypothetical protein
MTDEDDYSYQLAFSLLPGSYNTGDRDHTEPVSVIRVRGGRVYLHDSSVDPMFEAFAYRAKLVEDYDGSAIAYGWDRPDSDFAPGEVNLQKNLHPSESRHGQKVGLADAAKPYTNLWYGHDFQWVGVVSATWQEAGAGGFEIDDRPELKDRFGKYPVVQPATGPAPGYYVSQVPAVVDKTKNWWDQRRYADGNTFPYIVLNEQFKAYGCRIGDVGIAIRNRTGKSAAFALGDTGTYGHLGESSSLLYRTVSEGQGNADYVTFIVFPRSGNGTAEGLNASGAIEFRLSGVTYDTATNAEELPLLMALNTDLSRLHDVRNRLKAGKPAGFSLPDFQKMADALKKYGFDPAHHMFE